jgi:hypothetical protein
MRCRYNTGAPRIMTAAQLAILASVWPAATHAQEGLTKEAVKEMVRELQKIEKDTQLTAAQRAKKVAGVFGGAKGATQRATIVVPPPSAGTVGATPAASVPVASPPPAAKPNTDFSLSIAKDFTDVGILKFGDPASSVTGATLSYSDDRSAQNSSLTFQSIGTAGYKFINPDKHQTLQGLNYLEIGAYGGVDKFTNSNQVSPKTKTSDNVLYGGYLNLGMASSSNIYNYFRVMAGSITDDIAPKTLFKVGKTTVMTTETASHFAGAFEWFPAYNFGDYPSPDNYLGFYGNMTRMSLFPGVNPILQLDPELAFHYDNTFDSTKPLLFSNKSTATRLGPQIGFILTPFSDVRWLQALSIKTTYYWWHEFESNHNSYTLKTAINYDLPSLLGDNKPSGLSLSVAYQRGANVNTGQKMGLFTIGLSGVFCSNCNVTAKGGGG